MQIIKIIFILNFILCSKISLMKNNICNISFKSNIKFCKKEEFETNRPKNFSAEYPKDYNNFFQKQKKYKQ